MGFRNVVNDASPRQPRLRFQQCAWSSAACGQKPGVEFFDRMAGAGLSGFEASCQTEAEADELSSMLRDRGIAVGYGAIGAGADDLLGALELAHRMRADYFSVRVTGSLKSSPEIAEMLEEMYELVNDAGLPLFIETCAGSVTQDLRRTMKVAKRFKKIRFTGDFQHYVCAGDFAADWDEEVWRHFRRIALRCGNWHGRIPETASGEMGQKFKALWAIGFEAWLKKAPPGDVLPFCCEPQDGNWDRMLEIKRLADEAWMEATAARQAHDAAEPAAQTAIAADQGIH